jgi:hypothetical protein
MNKRLSAFILAVLLSPAAEAVCVPTQEFHKIFLGFGADGDHYAVGITERVTKSFGNDAQYQKESVWSNRICVVKVGSPNAGTNCIELPNKSTDLAVAQKQLRRVFPTQFKNWQAVKKAPEGTHLALMDCEHRPRDKRGECQVSLRSLRDGNKLDPIFKTTHQNTATSDVMPLLYTTKEIYFSRDKRYACLRFPSIRHESANCQSQEDALICHSTDQPALP